MSHASKKVRPRRNSRQACARRTATCKSHRLDTPGTMKEYHASTNTKFTLVIDFDMRVGRLKNLSLACSSTYVITWLSSDATHRKIPSLFITKKHLPETSCVTIRTVCKINIKRAFLSNGIKVTFEILIHETNHHAKLRK